jgi:hypothetical protein
LKKSKKSSPVKNKEKLKKNVRFIDTKQKKRWRGWRDYEKPSAVTTYKLSDLDNIYQQSKEIS